MRFHNLLLYFEQRLLQLVFFLFYPNFIQSAFAYCYYLGKNSILLYESHLFFPMFVGLIRMDAYGEISFCISMLYGKVRIDNSVFRIFRMMGMYVYRYHVGICFFHNFMEQGHIPNLPMDDNVIFAVWPDTAL